MEKSAGILLIHKKKILLCHPTNSPWQNTYSIPKGKIEKDENHIEAAIRETKEEVGITVDKSLINEDSEEIIEYKNKKGKIYKKVYYYPVVLNEIDEEIISKDNLQLCEVDWAGFLNIEEAKKKIFWRFAPMLKFIE